MQEDTIRMGTTTVTRGQVIPSGEEIGMLLAYAPYATLKDRDALIKWFARPTERRELARVEVVYSSVYDERWIMRGIGAVPEPLPAEAEE